MHRRIRFALLAPLRWLLFSTDYSAHPEESDAIGVIGSDEAELIRLAFLKDAIQLGLEFLQHVWLQSTVMHHHKQ